VIESISVQKAESGHWTITVTWLASGPVKAKIFVHIYDEAQTLIAQQDAPALGGMIPPWIWQDGDRIQDVRHILLPENGGPYTIYVGLYHQDTRFPAFKNGVRCPDDAAPIATIGE
jgi:hypothetical protein